MKLQTEIKLAEILTIKADDFVWKEKHKDYQKEPTDNLHHPTPMVQAITRILLIFHTDHQNRKDSEEQKIPQANPKNSISLKPFSARSMFEVIDP